MGRPHARRAAAAVTSAHIALGDSDPEGGLRPAYGAWIADLIVGYSRRPTVKEEFIMATV